MACERSINENSSLKQRKQRETLESWYQEMQTISDLYLRTEDGGYFPVHRYVLFNVGGYFKVLARNSSMGSSVLVTGVSSETLDRILRYIYMKETTITNQTVCGLWRAADFLLITDLVEECVDFMLDHINVANCVEFYLLSLELHHISIELHCRTFIQINFEVVIARNSDFSMLPFGALAKFLTSDYLNVMGEESIWIAIVRWVESCDEHKMRHVYELLRCIRLPEIPKSGVDYLLLSHAIVQRNPHCQEIIRQVKENPSDYVSPQDGAMWKLALETGLTCAETISRKPRKIYFFADVERLNIFEVYDAEFGYWRKICQSPIFSMDLMFAIGTSLYLFDTFNDLRCVYDVVEDEWRQISIPIDRQRSCYNVVCLKDTLYAFGAYQDQPTKEWVTTFEVFDPDIEDWTKLQPMRKMHCGPCAVIGENIYVIGDYFDKDLNCNVLCGEYYTPESNTWHAMSCPTEYRRNFALAEFHGYLYIIGGQKMSVGNSLTLVEKYNPETEEWIREKCLPFEYLAPKALVIEGVLVVYEGSRDISPRSPAVYWDNSKGSWGVSQEACIYNELYKYVVATMEDTDAIRQIRNFNNYSKFKPKTSYIEEDESDFDINFN